ncbi:glycosyltransferase family 2 protein [Puteibacter caeruleilacunae]|nr:glycosyltransferase family 2 protein [Puteibacter caeruleilacunae]
MKHLISIIVPVYNSEDYILECITSILHQTYWKIEVIAVNDGSNDMSGVILDELAKIDDRLKVSHTANNGVSSARNLALTKASGDYLMFVDSDDWIAENMIEDIVDILNEFPEVDLLRLVSKPAYVRNEQRKLTGNYTILSYDKTSYLNSDRIGGYMHSLFVRRSIVSDNNITFSEDMKLMEDQEFSMKCVLSCKSIIYYDKPHYFYYQSPGQSSRDTNNSIDILKCRGRVYRYARISSSTEHKEIVQEQALTKFRDFIRAARYDETLSFGRFLRISSLYLRVISANYLKLRIKDFLLIGYTFGNKFFKGKV